MFLVPCSLNVAISRALGAIRNTTDGTQEHFSLGRITACSEMGDGTAVTIQRDPVAWPIGALAAGWLVGAMFGASGWMVVVLLAVSLVWRRERVRNVERDRLRIELAHALANPRHANEILGEQLPPWVTFPKTERSAWLNALIEQLWPSIAQATANSLKASINPLLERTMPAALDRLFLEECALGVVPLRVLGVQSLTETANNTVIDLHVAWAGEPDVRLVATAMRVVDVEATVPRLTLKALLRVTLGPHCAAWPCFGAVSLSFIGHPSIDYSLVAARVPLDAIPGLSDYLGGFIRDTLFHMMVYPRRFTSVIVPGAEPTSTVAAPIATAVIQVHGASNLPKKMLQACDTKVVGGVTTSRKTSETPFVKNSTSPAYGDKRMTFTLLGTPDERVVFTVVDRFGVVGKVDLFTSVLLQGKRETHFFDQRIVGSPATKNCGKLQFSIGVEMLVPFARAPLSVRESARANPGVALVHVVSGTGFPRMSLLGGLTNMLHLGRSSTNFYVKCVVGNLEVRSWVASGTCDPVYNWHDHVDFRDIRSAALDFVVCTQEMAVDHEVAKGSLQLMDVAASHGKLRSIISLEPEGELCVEISLLMRVTSTDATTTGGNTSTPPPASPTGRT